MPLRGVILLLSDVVALLWAEAERAKKSQSHVTDNYYLPTENYSYEEKRETNNCLHANPTNANMNMCNQS